MTLLNWLPEIMLFIQLFLLLASLNFKRVSGRSLSLICSAFTLGVLVYYCLRTDLLFFPSPAPMLISDSLSIFGRLFGLLFFVLSSLNFHFHRTLNFDSKQKASLFLSFFSLFLCGFFQANTLLMMSVCWSGCYFALTNLALIESQQAEAWISTLRKKALPLVSVLSLFLALYFVTTQASGSIYINEFIEWAKLNQEHGLPLVSAGVVVVILGALLLHGLVLQGFSPISLAMFNVFIFVSTSVYWFRVGVPFLSQSQLMPAELARYFLGGLVGFFALRYGIQAARTQGHFRWLSSILPATIGFGCFALLLSVDQAFSAFCVLSLSYLFTFLFVGQAFLETVPQNKWFIICSLLALMGIPPMVLGEQQYRLVNETFQAGLPLVTFALCGVWFLIAVAHVQMFAKIILESTASSPVRKMRSDEVLFIAIYLVCVISLTALRPALLMLLNDHPLSYLW